ncbi:response regulator [Clostridium sp.]|uniref:response regulator n=1 Tax=Clostridium sp. TaxID=1506 RepID=UPI00260DB5B0|nr:response regulator [Clostridium sp.]
MRNILHIEQSSFFSTLVEKIVVEKGYKYINVSEFKEAKEMLLKEKIDLLITSLYVKDGILEELIRYINDTYDIPVFVVTSDNLDESRKELINLGINEYILKKDLESEVRKYIDNVFRTDEYMKDLQEAKIALVEDNDFFINLERKILNDNGILNVDYYKDGRSLLESGKSYDMYLIDIILKNEFGKDIIRNIRRNNMDSSIIAVTGLDNNKALAKILDGGADDYIIKPIDEELFISKLKSNIRIYNLQKKIYNLN